MTIRCNQVDSRIQQYLDRQLPESDRQALLAHLEQCETCRAAYAPLLETIRDVERSAMPDLPAGLLQRVLNELPAVQTAPEEPVVQRRRGRLVPWFSGIAAAAAILLVMFGRLPVNVTAPDDQTPIAAGDVDPQVVMILASAACTAPIGGNQANLGLVAGQVAAWQVRRAAKEPTGLALCMELPPDHVADSPLTEVLQVISSRAVLHRGL